MTLDDLDIEPAMFTTAELRTLFRLARERISRLEGNYASCCKRAQGHVRVRSQQRAQIFALDEEIKALKRDMAEREQELPPR
jgi:hypothetical protein